jgi:hypothetical protein
MVITDQQVFEMALPFLAYAISYLLQQHHWKPSINTIIAGVTILLASVCTLFLQHRLTPDVYADFLLVASVSAGLQSGALAPLSQWLKGIGGRPKP